MSLSDSPRPAVPKDVVKELGIAGVARLLKLMTDAYRDLRARKCVTAASAEDDITEEWFVQILLRWVPEMSLIPVHQKQDPTKAKPRGRRPTIDFCFRDRSERGAYFGAECKLLDEGDAGYMKAYLDDTEGIGRFLDGRYAAHTGAGAMVGYVRTGKCDAVATELSDEMQKLKDSPTLCKSTVLCDFDQLYESEHKRDCAVPEFLCFHLLFGFNCPAA